jgi:hypothetical protein
MSGEDSRVVPGLSCPFTRKTNLKIDGAACGGPHDSLSRKWEIRFVAKSLLRERGWEGL